MAIFGQRPTWLSRNPGSSPNTNPEAEGPRRRGFRRFWHALGPLIVIGLIVYVVYNFPALKQQVEYTVNKPKPGNTKLLPATVKAAQTSSPIPVGTGVACEKNILYDNNGNPRAICDNYIYIPKIRVAAPIVRPPNTTDATINEYLLKGVVHYPGTADPGQKGNVFLTGHSSYYWWVPTDFRNVLTLQTQLTNGDEIFIYHKGVRYTYQVSEKFEVAPTQVDVLKPTPDPVVTLSTCVPIGTSYRRNIVRAKQVSPDPNTARSSSGSRSAPTRLPGVR